MKHYKLKKSKEFTDGFELVNTKDSTDRIPANEDGFFFDKVYSDDDFEMRYAKYVSDSGIGTMLYAFKKEK